MAGSVDGDHGFQIAPMLDILFVLLLFFMVSAGAQKHETNLTTQLPGGAPGGDVPVNVTIDSDGQVSVNSVATDTPDNHDLPETIARLQGIVKAHATQPIVIIPTKSTRHQRVIDVLNACAAAEVKNLAFGTPED
jgi:biopolymer transport protein ExbD